MEDKKKQDNSQNKKIKQKIIKANSHRWAS